MSAPYYPGSLYTPNLGLSLFGQDEVLAENMVLLDSAFGDGSSINVNGTLVTSPNLNNTLPAAPAGKTNVTWQVDVNGNISAWSTAGSGGSSQLATLQDVTFQPPFSDGQVLYLNFQASTLFPNITQVQEDSSFLLSVTLDSVAGIATNDFIQLTNMSGAASFLSGVVIQVSNITGFIIQGTDPTSHGVFGPVTQTGVAFVGQWSNSQNFFTPNGNTPSSNAGLSVSNSALPTPVLFSLGSYADNATTDFPSGSQQFYSALNPTKNNGAVFGSFFSASDWINPNNYTGQLCFINFMGTLGGTSFGQTGTVPQDMYTLRIGNPANTKSPSWQASGKNIALWADDTYVSSLNLVTAPINLNGAGGNVNFGDSTVLASWTAKSGTPEGSITAPVGSIFSRTDGTATTALYFKGTGSGNTGWVAVPSSSSGGTVTTFSAGDLSPLFTTSVATATTTPALSFALSNAAQNSVFAGPASGGAGAPSYQTAPTISAANMTNFPTFNQNTTGTAANLSGTPTLPNGTAATTQITGDTSTKLATDAFVAAAIAAYTAPVTSVFTRTGAVTAQTGDYNAAQVGAISASLMTTLGDIIYENATPAAARLAGNTASTKMYLSQTGTGTVSAAPVWAQVNYADITGTTPTPPSGSVLWSALGNSGGALTLSNGINATTFNQTSNVAWLWANTTTGTSGTTNASPLLELAAQYYTGATGATDLWTLGSSLAAGTNGASTLSITHSGSTGTAAISLGSATNISWNGDIFLSRQGIGNLQIGATANSSSGGNTTLFVPNVSCISSVSVGTSGCGFSIDQAGATFNVLKMTTYTGDAVFGVGGPTVKLNTVWASGVTAVWSSTATLHGTPDTGISRLSAASLAFGNGTANDTSANLSFGKVAKYNGIATVSNGVPSELAVSDLTAQSAAITATTLYATTATGMYRVSWSATITTVDGVSSVLGGAGGFQVLYTSPTDSVVKTTVSGNSVTSAANTTGTAVGGCEVVYAKTGTNIQFTYGYTSATPGQMVFELHIKVESL